MCSRWHNLFAGGAVLLGVLLPRAPAHACTPPGPPGPITSPDLVFDFKPFDDGTDTGGRPQPQNVALVFLAETFKPATEATVRAQITVDITRDGVVVPGAMKPVEGLGTLQSLWQWLPADGGAMPVATFHVKVTNTGEPAVREYDIAVLDRQLVVPPLPLTVDVSRQIVADASAPPIACTNPWPGSYVNCGGALPPHTVPSRYIATAGLTYQAPEFARADYPYLASSARVFTRTKGAVVEDHSITDSWDFPLRRLLPLDLARADEYCVSVSAWVRTDPGHPVTVEECRPNGALDLSMTDDEQQKTIDDSLRGCDQPAPPSPAGGGPAGKSGCAAAPAPLDRGSLGAALLAIGLLLVQRTRRRHPGRVGSPLQRRRLLLLLARPRRMRPKMNGPMANQ